MKIMRKLYDQCMEELDGVIEYSNCATSWRNNPDLSKMYINMAKQELEHAQGLHNMSKKLADSKINESVDPMLMELWEEMEQAKIDKMALARAYVTNAEG